MRGGANATVDEVRVRSMGGAVSTTGEGSGTHVEGVGALELALLCDPEANAGPAMNSRIVIIR